MIGAIAGDIIGSVYETKTIKTKDFPLFVNNSFGLFFFPSLTKNTPKARCQQLFLGGK